MPKKESISEAPATPNDAATVIITRDSNKGQYQVYMMRRHKKQAFMGGAFVFPGGRLDRADCDPDLAAFVRGPSASEAKQLLQAAEIPEDKALGLYFAAIRETFEEAGILLAYTPSGQTIDFHDGETASRFATYRLKLHSREISLKEMAEKENILYALDLLTPYSHWITPEVEAKRFSARFFLARFPKRQLPFHDTMEMTESLWLSPGDALERHRAEKLLLMPPTLKTVVDLNEFASTDDLFSATATRHITPMLPQLFGDSVSMGIKLPHDPEYTIAKYKQPPRPEEFSRIVLQDGVWTVVKK